MGKRKVEEPFTPSFEEVLELCNKHKLVGLSGNAEKFAEFFFYVAQCEDGTLNYKGRPINNYATLVSMLKSVDIAGRQLNEAHRKRFVRKPARADEGCF